jgi:hypothetical protein
MAENSSQDTQALLQPGIQRFARSISGQPIGLAKYAPEPWGNIRLCFENASRKATDSGGQARFGRMFQHKLVAAIPGPGYLIAIHHAVWQAPTEYLYDVTGSRHITGRKPRGLYKRKTATRIVGFIVRF